MPSGPGIVGPASYPVRDPRDTKQRVGRILNPPRYNEIGTVTAASYPKGNQMAVEKPTRVNATVKTTKNKD